MNTDGQITVRQWFALPEAERSVRAETFRVADWALQANEDAGEYDRLNDRVADLELTVPWWVKAPALPHPGSRRRAALYAVTAVAVLAAVVMVVSLLSGCRPGWPCSSHGGVKWTNSKVYECNDGTWE